MCSVSELQLLHLQPIIAESTHPRKMPVWVGFSFARTSLLKRPSRVKCTACGRP